MSTKPSPDAIKMLKSIEEHFNQAFDANKYSALFRREYMKLFKINHAFQMSIYGSNDAYILGLGIIYCWDFDKNIKQIETKVNNVIKEKEDRIRWFENLAPFVENEKKEGKVDDVYVEVFNQTLEEAHKWKEAVDDRYSHLPLVFNHLKGKTSSDYQIVKKELSQETEWRKEADSSDALYQQFCNWLDLPSTKKQYGNRRWSAIKEKLALRGHSWFGHGEIQDLESAKRILSEVFYPDQEEYYKQLENWAKNEIEDKSCSSWISFFLWNGRTIPVRQVQLLKFKGNLEKGKTFLMSKYEEKLGWDKKKQKERDARHKSLFDTFDEDYSSFQEIWTTLENKYSLFPMCICSNVDTNNYPKVSMFGDWTDGVKLQHDTIHYNLFVENLTLASTNRYYYTYRNKYKKTDEMFILYSDESFKIIKEYLQDAMPEITFNENIVGCITLINYTSRSQTIGITALLSYSKDDYSRSSKVLAKFDSSKRCLASNGFQNTVGYRVFSNAVIYHIAKKIGHSIELPLDKTILDSDFKLLKEKIESKIDELSFEDRYLCHFIDFQYKFPTDQTDIFDTFRLSRRINLFHDVQQHYSTPIFQEWSFPYGKIVNQYNNDDFKKNTESVGGDFYKYRDTMNVWLDKTNKNFLFNLRTLCYLNWVFVCNETGNIKKLSSLWLYKTLYDCHLDAYQKDRAFFSSLLYYTLIQNERVFMVVIDKHVEGNDNKYDSSSIFYHLVRYYSNGFKGWSKEMSYSQLALLNDGKKKHEQLSLFGKNRSCSNTIGDSEILDIAAKIFDYISTLLTDDVHPHSEILEIFKDMKPFDIPNNFSYERRGSNNYKEYNGDYTGTYAHDVMGYTNDEIDTIFDGDPDAYWNID